MAACLEVILQASNLVVRPILTSLPTHCCITRLSCGVSDRMNGVGVRL